MDLSKVFDEVKVLLSSDTSGHDFEHTYRVLKTSLFISQKYEEADLDKVTLIALLHDVDDPKLFDTLDNENARKILKSQNIDKNLIEPVIAGINEISFSKNKDKKPSSIEAQIVQDADRLDAIGAIGIARAFAYGGAKHRSLEDTIAHFHEKLLLLKDKLNTQEARNLAVERHQVLIDFLKHFEKETK